MISKQVLQINRFDSQKVVFTQAMPGRSDRFAAGAIILYDRWVEMGQPTVVTMTIETGNTVYQR